MHMAAQNLPHEEIVKTIIIIKCKETFNLYYKIIIRVKINMMTSPFIVYSQILQYMSDHILLWPM